MKTPTARTLEYLRKLGYHAGMVEQRIPKTFITRDFMNWCDLIYLTQSNIVGVQVTSGANHASRRAKILAEPRALAWINAGGIIEVWSWAKQGSRGARKAWKLRTEEIVREDFK